MSEVIQNRVPVGQILDFYDIFTPGSFIRQARNSKYRSNLDRVIIYSTASIGEVTKLSIYAAFFTVAPFVPISMILIGVGSRLVSKLLEGKNG